VSPYFFNAGLLYSGSLLNAAADAYAKILTQSRIPDFDVLFGPAYKGISLAAVTTVALARDYGRDQTYCYNRKEKKDVSLSDEPFFACHHELRSLGAAHRLNAHLLPA